MSVISEQTTLCRALWDQQLFDAVAIPGGVIPHQDALDGTGVEIPQYFRRASEGKRSEAVMVKD